MSLESTDANHRLDVREIDGEPFVDNIAALNELEPGRSLLLVNSFRREPLYDVLKKRGFTYEIANPQPDVWHVEIEHARPSN